MLATTPKITYGEDEPYTEFIFPPYPIDDYDQDVILSQASEATSLDGDVESIYWNSVTHITFTAPLFTYPERRDFMNHYRQHFVRGGRVRFYPDQNGDSFFVCKFALGWRPAWKPLVPGVAFALSIDLRRIDVDELE